MSICRLATPGGGNAGFWKILCALCVVVIAALLGKLYETELAAWVERSGAAGMIAEGGGNAAFMRSLDKNGGWRTDAEAFAAYDCPCDIDHREDLTEESFFAEYYQKKPVIVPNLNVSMAGRWYELAKAFQKKALLRDHGHLTVKAGTSRGIPQASGDGYESMPLREFIGAMNDHEGAIGDEPLYVFDKNTFFAHAPELAAKLVVPDFLNTTRFAKLRPEVATLYFGVGEGYTGTQFHKHAQGWLLGIWGTKRFLLYPASKMPPRSYPIRYHSVRRWIDTLLPLLGTGPGAHPGDEPPMQCVVHPGQLLYVPPTMYHATMSIGDSVGVAAQVTEATSRVQQLWSEGNNAHGQGDVEFAHESYKRVTEIDPASTEGYYMVGLTAGHLGRSREAVAATRKGLALHPTHAEGFNQLGQALRQMRRNAEALQAFRRAVVLMPITTLAWNNIRSLHQTAGDEDGAMRAGHMAESISEMVAEWAEGPRRVIPPGASEVGERSYGARMTGPEHKARDEALEEEVRAATAADAASVLGTNGGMPKPLSADEQEEWESDLDKIDGIAGDDVTCEECHARGLGFCFSKEKGMNGEVCLPGKCVSNKIAGSTPPCGCGPYAHYVGQDQADIPIVREFGVPVGCPGDDGGGGGGGGGGTGAASKRRGGRGKRRAARGKAPPLCAGAGKTKAKKKRGTKGTAPPPLKASSKGRRAPPPLAKANAKAKAKTEGRTPPPLASMKSKKPGSKAPPPLASSAKAKRKKGSASRAPPPLKARAPPPLEASGGRATTSA